MGRRGEAFLCFSAQVSAAAQVSRRRRRQPALADTSGGHRTIGPQSIRCVTVIIIGAVVVDTFEPFGAPCQMLATLIDGAHLRTPIVSLPSHAELASLSRRRGGA